MKLTAWAWDLLFPKQCIGCGREGSVLCAECRPSLHAQSPSCPVCSQRNLDGVVCSSCQERCGIRRFFAPFSYRDALVRNLIHAYKYDGVRELSKLFAEEIASFFQKYDAHFPDAAILVPIPLHRSRERERGFNQSLLLADELGKIFALPVTTALRRTRATEAQATLASHEERLKNVSGVFSVRDANALSGKTAILIDDVSTSGSTLAEAARAVRAAGARTVWAIAIAKG